VIKINKIELNKKIKGRPEQRSYSIIAEINKHILSISKKEKLEEIKYIEWLDKHEEIYLWEVEEKVIKDKSIKQLINEMVENGFIPSKDKIIEKVSKNSDNIVEAISKKKGRIIRNKGNNWLNYRKRFLNNPTSNFNIYHMFNVYWAIKTLVWYIKIKVLKKNIGN